MRFLCAGALALLYSPSAFAQQQLAADRVEAVMIAAGRDVAMPIHEERLTVEIDGEFAASTLRQTFLNDSNGRIEGDYRLRPGSGCHVDGFAYWNGEAKIVGEVFERQTAHEVYNNVTARRRDPGLLEEAGEGAFAFKVFPVEAHENKRVEVRWNKWLERHAQTVRYRAPITSRDAEIVVSINGPIKNLHSSTHKLNVEKGSNGVRLRATGAAASGELDLEWDVDEAPWTPDVYVQPGAKNEEGWFALSLAAPKLPDNTVTAKDMTIVIDRSGSMNGEKMEHAKQAAADMVRLLGPNDHVNVISFSDEVDPLFKAPQLMDGSTRSQALDFIRRLHATGGTDIALALKTAVGAQDKQSERPQVVVFLTDGQSDAAQAVAVETGNVRLFTLGLGDDVNKPLLSRLAAQKRGRFVFIENAKSIESEVGRLAANIAKPLLVDVSIELEGANPTRVYPRTMPDVFAEDELRISGRMRGTGPAKFIIRGKLAGKKVEFTRSIDLAKAPARAWTAPLWAQSRIDHLLEEISLDGSKQEMKDEVLELALAYNFITPYTAFLAVPESELGAMTNTVAQARARKHKIMADNPDVASLDGRATTTATGSTGGQIVAQNMHNLPSPAPTPPRQGIDMRGADDDEPMARNSRRVAAKDSPTDEAGGDGSRAETLAAPRAHGCAGCAMTGNDGAASLVLVGLTALLLRRRRRA
jgi:Ca-activated chloride channel family protein